MSGCFVGGARWREDKVWGEEEGEGRKVEKWTKLRGARESFSKNEHFIFRFVYSPGLGVLGNRA